MSEIMPSNLRYYSKRVQNKKKSGNSIRYGNIKLISNFKFIIKMYDSYFVGSVSVVISFIQDLTCIKDIVTEFLI